MLSLGLVMALLGGCASRSGWSVTEARTCEPKAPAQVCSRGELDYGHVITLADVELLPGECVVAEDDGRGGLVRVETKDPRGEGRRRWIRAPRSRVTELEVREDGRAEVVERRTCDRSPY